MIPEQGLILLVNKPADMTSHDVVNIIRKKYNTRRVGHGGTLDPFATGLLIIGIGKATKKLTDIVGLDKTYEATATLGATTNTYDLTGSIVARPTPAHRSFMALVASAKWVGEGGSLVPRREDVEKVLENFRGTIEQKAPAYSAKKVGGKKLYALARAGENVEHLRPTKKVDITELVITDYNFPTLKFRVTCSSGTYIRSLANDIGEILGCGAYLTQLRRTRIGSYEIIDAKELDSLS